MSRTILQFQKQQVQLRSFTLQEVPITKQDIQAAILRVSGLESNQYQIAYLDSQNDRIMAAVEQDFLIAEQTLEDDTIVFQVEVKVDPETIKFTEEEDDDDASSFDSGDQALLRKQQSAEAIYNSGHQPDLVENKEAIQGPEQTKNQQHPEPQNNHKEIQMADSLGSNIKLQIKSSELLENRVSNDKKDTFLPVDSLQNNQHFMCSEPVSSIDQQIIQSLRQNMKNKDGKQEQLPQQYSSESLLNIKSDPLPQIYCNDQLPEKQLPMGGLLGNGQNLTEPKLIDTDELLQDQKFMEALMSKLTDRLPSILTPQCFKTTTADIRSPPQSKYSEDQECLKNVRWTCFLCSKAIMLAPFYLNSNNQAICVICQETVHDDLLVKVKSPQMMDKLAAVALQTHFRKEQDQGPRMEWTMSHVVRDNLFFNRC